jgi:hypothetical protein
MKGGLPMWKLVCAAVGLAVLVPVMASADACDHDRVTVCKDVTPGDGHVYDCLLGRSDRLTPACAAAVSRASQLADAVIFECKSDAQIWCAQHTSVGRGAVIDCLKAHKDKVNNACKSKYRQFKAAGFDIKS